MRTIFRWLGEQEQRKTAIFIAHRLATIADCDIIYVLKDGMIDEFGDHETLLAMNGTYAKLWAAQSQVQSKY